MRQLVGKRWIAIEGVWMPINTNLGYNTLRWILNKKYEQEEIRILKHNLSEHDIVLEIGTGLGFISSFCSKKVGSENVFTYEANPFNYQIAQAVFIKNKVCPSMQNAILADKEGKIKFPIDNKNRLASSLLKPGHFAEVKSFPLNSVISDLTPTYLVMDIEGGEYEIIKIMVPGSIQKIQFELHPDLIGNEKCNEIFQILANNGFLLEPLTSGNNNFLFKKRQTSDSN